ncbi:MAG: hypothetical protein RL122_1990, partial [Pseudomonadota bacterium]
MRFVVPILSSIAVALACVWVLSSGQLSKLFMTDALSGLTETVPHLLLAILAAQVGAVYLLKRTALIASRTSLPDVNITPNTEELLAMQDQV